MRFAFLNDSVIMSRSQRVMGMIWQPVGYVRVFPSGDQ